jgi:NAD(P)-dependent dehydrogenase (short-subunit alcohol dehydrogenase family)
VIEMTRPLHERHALITGAGSGIGAAIALALAQQGCRLTLMGRSMQRLETQAQSLREQVAQVKVEIVSVDVSDMAQVQSAVAQAQERAGAVHILINNAGLAQSQPFVRTDPELWQRTLAVNLNGTYHMTYSVLPAMLQAAEQGTPGRIIQVASTAGLMGYPYVSAYTAAKHGVIGLTRALALELARQNITVNAVCPGYTDTAIVSQAIDNIVNKTGQSEEQARLALAQRNPMRRLVQPNEVADAVTWLCQPSSASINGQAIAIDGGEQAG